MTDWLHQIIIKLGIEKVIGVNFLTSDGQTPTTIDKIIKEFQEKIRRFLPGGSSSGGKQAILVLIILGFVWLASGLYRVLPDEQGVVLRFGKFVKTTQPGLNYHIPFPVESVETPKVTKVNRIDNNVLRDFVHRC